MEELSPNDGIRKELPDAWGMIKDTFRSYLRDWKTILKIFIFPYILFGIGGFLTSYFDLNKGEITPVLLINAIIGIIVSFLGALWSALSTIVFLQYLAGKEEGREYQGLVASLREGRKLFWPFVWVSILLGLAQIGGFILLIVPGVILAIYLIFTQFVVVEEGKRGLNALLGSVRHVKGYWKDIFAKLFLFVLSLIPVALVLFALLFLSNGLFFFGAKEKLLTTGPKILLLTFQSLWQLVFGIIFTPLTLMFLRRLYREVKAAKSGLSEEFNESRIRKILVALPIIGLVLGAAFIFSSAALVVLTREKGDLAGMKEALSEEFTVFKAPQYGITLSHPQSWAKVETELPNTVAIFQSPRNSRQLWDVFQVLHYKLAESEKNTTLEEVAEGFETVFAGSPDTKIIEKVTVQIAGVPAIRILLEQGGVDEAGERITVKSEQYYLLKGGAVYAMLFTYGKGRENIDLLRDEIIQKIVASVEIK